MEFPLINAFVCLLGFCFLSTAEVRWLAGRLSSDSYAHST